MDREKVKTISYGLGIVFADTVLASATVSVIALTIKFVMWLF